MTESRWGYIRLNIHITAAVKWNCSGPFPKGTKEARIIWGSVAHQVSTNNILWEVFLALHISDIGLISLIYRYVITINNEEIKRKQYFVTDFFKEGLSRYLGSGILTLGYLALIRLWLLSFSTLLVWDLKCISLLW
jgi:hypothetical protein